MGIHLTIGGLAAFNKGVAMAGFPVTGDQYWKIDRRMGEIKRQLSQKGGSPLDPERVLEALQDISEGRFGTTATPSVPLLWRKVDENTIEVNLDFPPRLPSEGARQVVLMESGMSGWVRVGHRGDKLFVAGREVVLYLLAAQKTGTIVGYDVLRGIQGRTVLHPNILDALMENTHLVPVAWRQDEQGHRLCIFFWAIGFTRKYGDKSVRCLCWDGEKWFWHNYWLDYGFNGRCLAAVCEESLYT